jgi:hypothetical protein
MQFVTTLQESLPQLESYALSQADDNAAIKAAVPSISALRDYAALVEALRVKRDAILTAAAAASIAKAQAATVHSTAAADAVNTRASLLPAVDSSTGALPRTAAARSTAAASSKPRLAPRQTATSSAARSKAGEAERRVADAVAEDISDLANQLKYSATEVRNTVSYYQVLRFLSKLTSTVVRLRVELHLRFRHLCLYLQTLRLCAAIARSISSRV